MSNRKEILKKSLGISEYPWSSDDEDNESPQTIPELPLRRRQSSDARPSVGELPGTSAQSSVSTPTPAPRRNQTGVDRHRQTFCTLLSHPARLSDVTSITRLYTSPSAGGARGSHESASQAASDIQRIIAFKRLARSLTCRAPPCAPPQPAHATTLSRKLLSALRGSGGGEESSLQYASPLPHLGVSRFKRVKPARTYPGCNRASNNLSPPPSLSRSHSYAGERDAERHERHEPAPADVLHDESVEPPPSPPVPSRDEIDLEQDSLEVVRSPSVVEVQNTSGSMSLEEEIVTIEPDTEHGAGSTEDARPASPHDVTNDDNDVMEVAAEGNAAESTSHGTKRKREDDNGEPHTVKELNQSLLRLLECPVCLEWMEPPMSQCRRGHLVCGRCRARLASCPVCRTAFSSVRNRAMEGVAEMLRYPCRHGCGREVRLRRRAPHEASCPARRYPCPAPACAHRPPLSHAALATHLQSKHPPMVKNGRKHTLSMKVNAEQHDTWVVMALRELFYLRVDVDIRTWGVVVYVAYIGPKCNARNFTYEVSVMGQHNARKLVYARTTHSDLESSSLNVSRQDCFHLTLDQALNFLRSKNKHCESDNFLDFNVEIARAEPAEEKTREES